MYRRVSELLSVENGIHPEVVLSRVLELTRTLVMIIALQPQLKLIEVSFDGVSIIREKLRLFF